MKMIIGLGNPGKEYANTKHNVGFMVIDAIAKELNEAVEKKQCQALTQVVNWDGEKILLVKPQTYMNLSGQSVIELLNYYNDRIDDLLVIHDDLDLPPGQLRFKQGGGAGGMLMTVGMIVVMIGAFYFFGIRPQKKQEKEANEMRNSLEIGDEIVTIGGIIGKVVKVKDDYVVIETGADKARLKMRKTAIASVEKKADDEGNNQRTTFKVKAGKNEVPHDPENK